MSGGTSTTQSEKKFLLGSSRSVPGEAQAHGPGYTHHHEAVGASLQVTFYSECGDCLGVWDTLWDAEEQYFGIVQDF